jgi:hypothetical protein
VEPTFTIKVGDTAVDLTGYPQILVHFTDESGQILARYAKGTKTGYNTADFVQSNQTTNKGQFIIKLQSVVTATFTEGCLYVDVKASETNTNYASNTFQSQDQINQTTAQKVLVVKNISTGGV